MGYDGLSAQARAVPLAPAALAIGVSLLAVLAALALLARQPAAARAARWGGVAVALAGIGLLAGALLGGGSAGSLALPLGLPGHPLLVRLGPRDGLSLLAALAAGAVALAASEEPPARLLAALAAALLALLAADPEGRLLGVAGLLLAARGGGNAGRAVAVLAVFGAGAAASGTAVGTLLAAFGLAGLLAVLAACAAEAAETAGAAGAGLAATLGALVVVQGLAHLALPASAAQAQGWFPVAALPAGALLGLGGAVLGLGGERIGAVAAGALCAESGLGVLALALAAIARDMDRPATLAVAATGAEIAGLTASIGAGLLFLLAGRVRARAGSGRLDALGGLAGRVPRTVALLAVAAFALSALPPGAGFAALRRLLVAGADIAAQGREGPALAAVLAVAAAIAIAALSAASMLRLWGIASLGRPRTPRAAGAEEKAQGDWPLAGLALALLALGLVPPPAGGPGAARLALLLLALLLLAGTLLAALWRRAGRGMREVEPWDGGRPALPSWLPFGDPAGQVSAAGFAWPERPRWARGRAWFGAWRGAVRSVDAAGLVLALVAAGLLLAALGARP